MDIFTAITTLIGISALLSYVNARFVRLPGTIGLVFLSLILTIFALIIGNLFPAFSQTLRNVIHQIDFSRTLLEVMLGFLLFAAALHVDLTNLKKQVQPILILSTESVFFSTALFGAGFYGLTYLFHLTIPLVYCILFGALISPTDPVAVGAILKQSSISKRLETIITGESLFNDGVGIVLFITLQEIAQTGSSFSATHTLLLFCREVFGGIGLGLLLSYLAYRLIRKSDEFQTVILLSLALVMITSVVASTLHLSVPLAVVSAGLLLSSRLPKTDQVDTPRSYLSRFWHLIDELLNTILFVMIGLQIIALPFSGRYLLIGILAAGLVIITRGASIFLPFFLRVQAVSLNSGNLRILTWAGLRGGVSIALALSLPDSIYKEPILVVCYCVVIVSIIGQGLSLKKLVNAVTQRQNS